MKKIISFFAAAALMFSLAPFAAADYDPDTDYMAEMMEAAEELDSERGEEAEKKRNEKIADMGLDYPTVNFTELLLLSKIIYAEAGSVWLDLEWKMCVGEVVLNRMASPEFPDTMQEVLDQPGQYYGKGNPYFAGIRPSATCVIAAKKLLEGERVINDPSVVFQSNYILGSGVCLELFDSQLGYTYLCYSSHPELYAG